MHDMLLDMMICLKVQSGRCSSIHHDEEEARVRQRINMLREFSIPLICGVALALIWANHDPAGYHHFIHNRFFGSLSVHFITNEIFMVLFFGIAAVEITQSCLPGGDLNPLRKAVNPLLATFGGVVGPIAIYLLLNSLIGSGELSRGWGIPTATDIALAWLAARLVFGENHPAISFLLLLAIVDDAIGLAIIAVFYPDPSQAVQLIWLVLVCVGMIIAWLLRSVRINSYWPYLVLGGSASWAGLYRAHLHPALALVFIIPFLPHMRRENKHIFEEDLQDRSTLSQFEHEWKVVVDFGLFLFGLVNAGVEFTSIGTVTGLVFTSLVVGKTTGICLWGYLGEILGFSLPEGMHRRDLLVIGLIAGIGFTVSLFVAGEAFADQQIQGAAKMGALLSIIAGGAAMVVARMMGIKRSRS